MATFGEIERGLDAGDAAPTTMVSGLTLTLPGKSGSCNATRFTAALRERRGLAGGLRAHRMHPRAMLAHVGHLEEVAIESGPLAGASEGELVHHREQAATTTRLTSWSWISCAMRSWPGCQHMNS